MPREAIAARSEWHLERTRQEDWVWQFGLYPVDETRTRLVSRSSVRTQTVWARLFTYAIEPAGFVMTRRMLLGLKQRAAALAAAQGDSSVRAA